MNIAITFEIIRNHIDQNLWFNQNKNITTLNSLYKCLKKIKYTTFIGIAFSFSTIPSIFFSLLFCLQWHLKKKKKRVLTLKNKNFDNKMK